MAKPIKRMSGLLNNITFPQLICARYDAKNGVMASITTILAMIGYTAAQFVSGAAILHVLTGWSLSVCYLIAVAVITFYVSTGGLLAVTYTDTVQMILLIVGVVILGVPFVSRSVEAAGLSFSDLPDSYYDLGAWGWGTIIAFGLSTILSFFTCMDSYTRCIAAKNERAAKRGTIYAAVAVLVIAGASTYLGMAGKLLIPDIDSPNNIIAQLVIDVFPHGLKGLVLIGVLSAIMSTADISVLTGSASLTKDIYQRYVNPGASEKALLRIGLISSLLIGAVAAFFGWFNQNIMNILMITFTINSAGLFLPTVGGFFLKRSCSSGAFASMVSATVISIVWYVGAAFSDFKIFQVDALWPAFGVSSLLYFIACILHKQTSEEKEKAEVFYKVARKNVS
jgi:SSS family solute:Na+ symporter